MVLKEKNFLILSAYTISLKNPKEQVYKIELKYQLSLQLVNFMFNVTTQWLERIRTNNTCYVIA